MTKPTGNQAAATDEQAAQQPGETVPGKGIFVGKFTVPDGEDLQRVFELYAGTDYPAAGAGNMAPLTFFHERGPDLRYLFAQEANAAATRIPGGALFEPVADTHATVRPVARKPRA